MNNIINYLGMEFVWIEPGKFLMGSPKSEPGRESNETQHQVILTQGFYAQTTLVTQKQYRSLMKGNNPSKFKSGKNPVDTVTWHDCKEFIARLNRKDETINLGIRYRLPTEAEWEYCCRAGTTTPFYFGDTINEKQANYDCNDTYGGSKKGKYRGRATAVKTFKPNAFGLYDMHGNVYEWCEDCYEDYPSITVINPIAKNNKNVGVVRGGGWYSHPQNLRSAHRNAYLQLGGYCNIGFRVFISKINII
jgi:formylglycine-generating enzyme required for sulfatase activity